MSHKCPIPIESSTILSQGAESVCKKITFIFIPHPGGDFLATTFFYLSSTFSSQIVWSGSFLDEHVIIKQRFSKSWRHPTLDAKLIARRTAAEVRTLARLPALGVPVPMLRYVDAKEGVIVMTKVPGVTLKVALRSLSDPAGELHEGTLLYLPLSHSAQSLALQAHTNLSCRRTLPSLLMT